MLIFEKTSPDNTPLALKLAFDKANALNTDVVLSSSSGASAFAALELAAKMDFKGKIVVITTVWGMRGSGENPLTEANRQALKDKGAVVITAAHTLSGTERAISNKFGGAYPVEIIAHTLRMFSQGIKVCVEVASMALDAGAIPYASPVVALGGTGRGLDSAVVITPGYSAKIFEGRINEILCKPF